jgi:capsular polysaccharide biosynthesis protein
MARLIALRLTETYFRHRWLYWLPTVLMLVLGAAYFGYFAERVYIVRGVLYVQSDSLLNSLTAVLEQGAFTSATPAEYTASQIDELLQTNSFIRSIIAETRLEEQMDQGPVVVEELISETREAVWVEVQGSNQLMVAAAHDDPNVAYELANGLVNRFVQWRINADRRESATARDFFSGLITAYQVDLDGARASLQTYLEEHPEPIFGERPASEELEIERLRAAVQMAQTRYSAVIDKEESARLALVQVESNVNHTYFLIDSPTIPVKSATSLRSLARNVVLVTAVGTLLSVVALVGAMLLDRSPRFPLEFESRTGLPVLAMVPVSEFDSEQELQPTSRDTDPGPDATEVYYSIGAKTADYQAR